MRKFMRYATVPMSIAALSACADQSSGPTGPQGNINLSVAPLSLPGIDDADYAIVVTNGAGDIVWQEEALTSNQYGDGAGSLTYVGTCDADEPVHTIALTTKTLTDSDGTELFAAGEAVNPCPAAAPCELTASCVENSDVFVEFNLAIMRDANQGFFDVAVNFQDIFCSAKVDCQAELLHDPATGLRAPTAVIGFACTSGASSISAQEPTNLYVDYIVDGVGLDETIDGNSGDGQYAIYKDDEELAGYTKGFWNAAVLIPSGGVVITGVATAAPGALPSEAPGTFNNYPVIGFNVTVPQNCAGAFPVQLDSGNGVDTFYSDSPATEGTYESRAVQAPTP